MSLRTRRLLRNLAIGAVSLLLLAVVAAILIVRSQWFYENVRQKIVTTVEDATGGRVELRAYRLDWRRLRAEVDGFVLHGSEPEGKPPLLAVSSVAVGLKIVSVFKQQFDVQYLDVIDPRIYLIVYPDGRTNVPEPKIKKSHKNAAETILDLAIQRFQVQNGVFEVESRSRTPFDAAGQNLNARMQYETIGPLYRGDISIQPLEMRWPGKIPVPVGVNLSVTVEKNRIGLASGKLATADSAIDLAGSVDDLNAPRVTMRYDARVSVPEAARILKLEPLRRGTVQVAGDASWAEGPGLAINGRLHGEQVEYRDSTIHIVEGRVDGPISANPNGLDVRPLQISGIYLPRNGRVLAEGQIAQVILRGSDLELKGVALNGLGGNFRGDARLRKLDTYVVAGDIQDFAARRTVALYSPQALPWDARASGTILVEGSLRRKEDLRVSGQLWLAPAPESAPVYGQVAATYEARNATLDLGHSNVSLPHSRAEVSGAIGRELRVHAETRDLNDILPALGGDSATFPVKLESGAAIFDGTVTGNLNHPAIAGHLHATGLSCAGVPIDSLEGEATASPENVQLQNATAKRGMLAATFHAAMDLMDWKITDASRVFGEGSVRNASLTEVAAEAGRKDIPATGTVNASGQLTGVVANPLVKGTFEVTNGSFQGEPFDQLTGRLDYGSNHAQIADLLLIAGTKQVNASATYDHQLQRFDTGRLHFQISSNVMSLDQIEIMQKERPGVRGTVRLNGIGDLGLSPAKEGEIVRLANLQAEVIGENLQVTGQPLGNAHLVANSQGSSLKANLDATFADSRVRGEGEWRLEGDYPGAATVRFTKVDLAQLRTWISPSSSPAADRVAGSAEGELRISGPILKTEALRAELRLPKFAIGSTPASGLPASYSIQNSGPLVFTLVNSVVTVESARFTGRDTDLALTGKLLLKPKNSLDLRVDGHVGLGILHDIEDDLVAQGVVTAEAVVRGDLGKPQINGRLQFKDAAFSVADLPNGISKAEGLIVFNGDRATIQTLSGETGGGKISLTGFFAYGAGTPFFSLAADASQVRVRYPPGVSTVANTSLTLVGNEERSVLGGSVTIVRTGINLQSDFSSILAGSAEPVRTPTAQSGLLAGMSFDVQVNTDPDIQFQSSLTQDLQVDGNLRLRGTARNPALLGRINITQGQVLFYGTKYTINQGSISFYNTSTIDPIFDIDLETKARGIDITLTLSGPLNKLSLTHRSDPPMQLNEIIELIATGRTPTGDSSIRPQTAANQTWQQVGASQLLGRAIDPVAGRLQRFFGVSKLRIDPSLPGVENNLQARLTLEQQVTPDITFTYITNLTNSNPQIVQVEWSVSKQWSVIALREENGVFGLDFFFKRRF